MSGRGRNGRSTNLQVLPSDSFQTLEQEPESPIYSNETTLAEPDYARSESPLLGKQVPGAFPRNDITNASRTTGRNTQPRRRNDINGQHDYISMDTPDNDAENNGGNIHSNQWRRELPSENDRIPLSELFQNPPDYESEHLGLQDIPESSRRLPSPEGDPRQWRRVAGSETHDAIDRRPFLREYCDDGGDLQSKAGTEMWNNLHGQGRSPVTEVDSDQWGRTRPPGINSRPASHTLDSHWDPPSEPIATLLKRGKGRELRQLPPSSKPAPSRGVSYGGHQHCQAESSSGPSSIQRRQTAGSEHPREVPAAGPSSVQQRQSPGNELRGTGAPPGAPTGPRRGPLAANRHQTQTNVPPRREDRRVTFNVDSGSRTSGADPLHAGLTTREPRRRAVPRGNEPSPRQTPSAPNIPPSTSRGARQTPSSTTHPTIPTTTKVVQRTSPPANKVTQQETPAGDKSSPQQDPTPEPRKRTRTRTRNRRKKGRVWSAVCSNRRYILSVLGSVLLLVVVLVVVLEATKP